MPYCAYGSCNSDSKVGRPGYDPTTKFYRFPQPCLLLRDNVLNWSDLQEKNHVRTCEKCSLSNIWLMRCRRVGGRLQKVRNISKDTTLCSKHFDETPDKLDYRRHFPFARPAIPSTKSAAAKTNSESCFVPNCNASWTLKFKAPQEQALRRQWETIIGRTDGRKLTANDVVCELHFMKVMIKLEYEKQEDGSYHHVRRLVDEAVPTIFPNAPSTSNNTTTTTTEETPSTPLPSTSSSRPAPKSTKKPVRRKCCVPNCSSTETSTITLHRFPVQQARCKTWLNLLNMSNFKPNKLTRVCSKHFASASFSSPGELRSGAIPKLYSSSNRKVNQELDPDSLLSEAQKTAAWLQSVKQRREERKLKRSIAGPPPPKVPKTCNPWGVKDCEVVIGERERKLADEALSRSPPNYVILSSGCLNVPMPIVEVKEEPVDVMDSISDGPTPIDASPSPKFKTILPKWPPKSAWAPPVNQPTLTPIVNTPQLMMSSLSQQLGGNNLLFKTTVRSGPELKSVQQQPLAPSTIYRVIIPTSVEGHTIQTEEILEQLKDKIKAMHSEKITKKNAMGSTAVPISIPVAPISVPSTPVEEKSASLNKSSSPTTPKSDEKVIGVTGVKTSKIIFTEKVSAPTKVDHAYAINQPKAASWPIIVQTPTIQLGSNTTSIPAQTSSPGPPPAAQLLMQVNPDMSSFCSVTPLGSIPITETLTKPHTPVRNPVSLLASPMSNVTTAVRLGDSQSFVTTRTQSTQTLISTDHLTTLRQVSDLKRTNESYRMKIKTLRQNIRRAHDRLLKTSKELDKLKSQKNPPSIEIDRGKEHIIVVEATDKCDCFTRRKEHEDVGDILRAAAQRKVPPPEESRALLLENEKLIRRISQIKRRLNQKDILRVVVFQTEDLISVL